MHAVVKGLSRQEVKFPMQLAKLRSQTA